jgi:hypothetical protein
MTFFNWGEFGMPEESSGEPAGNPAEDERQQTDGAASPEINWANYYTRKMLEDSAWWDDFSLGVAAFVFGLGCLVAILAGIWGFAVLVSRQQFLYGLLDAVGTILTAVVCYAFVVLFLRVRKL